MARPASTDFDREIRSQVAANLNNLLRKRGWTKSDLSKETEISPSTLSGYFNEKYNITPGNLQKIADVFKVEKGDIDPRYKIKKESTRKFLSRYFETTNALADDINRRLWYHSLDADNDSSDSSRMPLALQSIREVDDDHKLIFTLPATFNSPNSLAKRKAIVSKPPAELNLDGELDKFTLRTEARIASALLSQYIETASQLLLIPEKIKPSEDLQSFLTVVAGTITVAKNIKKEYSEILNNPKNDK